MSNGKWIYVILMILMSISHTRADNQTTGDIFPTSTQYQPTKDEICYNVMYGYIDSQGYSHSNAVAMGRTKKGLLLITKDLYVYDAPVDSFDSTRNTTHFKYMPTPMKDKYPVLYDNSIFKKIKNNMIAWIMHDSDGDWICMTASDGKQGINYNIDKSEIHEGFVLSERPEALIETNEPCKCYSLQRREAKENGKSLTGLWLTAYKCKNGDRIINSGGIEKVTDFRLLCYDENIDYILMIQGKKCDSMMTVEWTVGTGLVIDGKFVLIGDDITNIFSENVFTQKGKKIYITQLDNDHFFKCDGIIPPNKLISKSYFYWTIAAIVLLVIIISSVYVAHRSLANRKKTRSCLERSSKISLSKSSIKVATKRSLKSKSKSKTSRIKSSSPKNTSKSGRVGSRTSLSGRSTKATSPGSRTSLSGRSTKATSPGSRTSLSGRLRKATSPGSRTSLSGRLRKATSPGSRTSLSGRLRKATSPGSRTSLSGRLRKATSPGSRTSLKGRSRKATSPGNKTSLSGILRKATSPGSRASLKGRSARPTSPMSKMSLNRLKRSKSRLNSISRGGSTSKLASLIKHIS
ncbi:uncharacterized protein LOC113798264 [Dermatophagoides pteronyssinus]|uniref:uncharacterized protein LOC113798264 n=1 Tax=Dermatophagoides pteronyssinus TaxID=6956 RepID=UPI003F6696AF